MKLEKNFNLKAYNTFHLDVKTAQWLSVNASEELQAFIKEQPLKEVKHFVVGEGSNLLFLGDYDGLIIKVDINFIELVSQDEENVIVRAGAGVIWDDFVAYTAQNNYWGLENLSHIPGTVGASPVQNIGAYGVEAKDCIYKVKAIHKNTGECKIFTNTECQFAYRDSYFKKDASWIVTEVEYLLSKKAKPNVSYKPLNTMFNKFDKIKITDIRNAIIDIRDSKLPKPEDIGNAGSFFKNPVVERTFFETLQINYSDIPHFVLDDDTIKIPAAWLIDTAGWKGVLRDKAGVHKHQALVLVNYGGATGEEIYKLSEDILKSVKQKFDITLEREVIVIT